MDNEIDPTAILKGDIRLGTGNIILPYCVLTGPLDIGNNNIIGPHTVIGSPGQDTRNPRYNSTNCLVQIGDDNIIREHVSIQKPCYSPMTRIGNRSFLMHNALVNHDGWLEDDIIMGPGAAIAGHVRVLQGANLSMGCMIHQHSVIGQYAIVAMGAAVTKNIKPFSKHIPKRPIRVNHYAIKRSCFSNQETEIMRYVLDGIAPDSVELLSIVQHYAAQHQASGRGEY